MNRFKRIGGILAIVIPMMALLVQGCVVRRETVVISDQPTGDQTAFTILNRSNEAICYVYISPTSSSTWGSDQLGPSETISPGYDRTWGLPTGYYDFRFEDCNNYPLMERRNVGIDSSGVTVTFRVRE